MGEEFLRAVAAFPTVLFTAALVVVIGFWLLVLLGVAGTADFDTDVDGDALGLGGVPVSVALSLVIAQSWCAGVTGSVLLFRTGWPPAVRHLLGVVLLFASLAVARCLTGVVLRAVARQRR
ncbi:hypothetical protein ACLGI4_14235 [Streptomyces sp. HMX112]|uniref:hypothetical protein n=1 Tax=Streptomyces sp. HMX112 TaxID=3390850 RepID=UPI003A7FC97B